MRIATRLIPIFFIAILAIILTACTGASAADSQDSVVEQVLQRGVLRVGMSTFVPWAMKDKTGELIGFEIDVARRLAEDMGVKVEFIPTKWSGHHPGTAHRQIRCHYRRHGHPSQPEFESQLHQSL